MIVLRLLTAVLAVVAATLAVAGAAVTQSLSGADAFVADMDQALTQPAVQQELRSTITAEVTAAGEQLAARAGPLDALARMGTGAVAGRIADSVSGEAFQRAWSDWSRLLYTGLTNAAAGIPDDNVTVTGPDLVVAIEPLVTPLVGESWAGQLSGVLSTIGRDTTITVTTAIPLQRTLQAMHQLSQWRWTFAGAAVVLLVVTVFAGARRAGWAAGTLALAAVATGAVGLGLRAAAGAPPPGAQYPAISQAVTEAVTASWAQTMVTAAGLLLATAAVAAVVGLIARASHTRAAG